MGIHDDALAALKAYDWPRNVRQLENAIRFTVEMGPADPDLIGVEDLPEYVREWAEPEVQSTRRMIPKAELRSTLAATGGNVPEAARILNVTKSYIYRLQKRFDL